MGAIKLESDVAGVVDVLVRGRLYGVRYTPARCSQIFLAVNMEENEVGIWSQRRAVVRRMGVESSGYWRFQERRARGKKKETPTRVHLIILPQC